jgi:TonB family protein
LRKLFCFVFLFALTSIYVQGQESASGSAEGQPDPGEHVKVYSSGPDLDPPTLLPHTDPVSPAEKCSKKLEGKVSLDLIVDSTGHAPNVTFVQPNGTVLDDLALVVAESDRFQPGTYRSSPVAFQRTIEMRLKACVQIAKDDTGKSMAKIKLRQWPEQKLADPVEFRSEARFANHADPKSMPVKHIGTGVTAPRATFMPNAEFTEEARAKKIEGTCVLTLVVDAHGMPQDIHVSRKLDPGLDANAIAAVSRYRFKPAYQDGEPVPVMVSVEVRYALY